MRANLIDGLAGQTGFASTPMEILKIVKKKHFAAQNWIKLQVNSLLTEGSRSHKCHKCPLFSFFFFFFGGGGGGGGGGDRMLVYRKLVMLMSEEKHYEIKRALSRIFEQPKILLCRWKPSNNGTILLTIAILEH